MRKHELVRAVAEQTRTSEAQAAAAVNAVFSTIQKTMANGDEVAITGFGSFRVVKRAPRAGRHPRTGGPMEIEGRRSPVFRPGTGLKRAVGQIP